MYTTIVNGLASDPASGLTPRMGLLCFAFGVARGRSDDPLPGPVLVQVLADLGLSAPAARSLILRMRREGWLTATPSGRRTLYRLAPIISMTESRLERQLRGNRPEWDGAFATLLYSIPERDRAFRDRLRRAAQLVGYAPLRSGLLIAATDRWDDLHTARRNQPADSQLLRGRLELSKHDSRHVADQLWQLAALAARYRSAIDSSRAATRRARRRPPRGSDALRAFAATTLPLYDASAADPDLPAALLPGDWPGTQLATTLGAALQAFGPSLAEYVVTLRADQ